MVTRHVPVTQGMLDDAAGVGAVVKAGLAEAEYVLEHPDSPRARAWMNGVLAAAADDVEREDEDWGPDYEDG